MNKHRTAHFSARGFSVIELMTTVLIAGALAAMTVPATLSVSRKLRSGADIREIHSAVSLAKMRAAANFTNARVYVDLATNTFRVQQWDKTGSWVTEGPLQSLSNNTRFGFGSLGSPPANTQAAIGQAPLCRDAAGATVANTACILFNSRGIPVVSTTAAPWSGAPTGNGALYLNDASSVYGLTLSATGVIRTWRTDIGAANWKRR
jgi:Tfp pilus assembly protein FimT